MKQSNVEALKTLIQHHNATEGDWLQALKEIEEERAEKRRRDAETAEKYRLSQIEAKEPSKFVPKEAKSMHVYKNLMGFKHLCATCDLRKLKKYTFEIANGEHANDFATVDTTKVVQFLLSEIALREATDKSKKPTAKNEKTAKLNPEYSR